MSYCAGLAVRRRTMSRLIQQTMYAYGDTPAEAYAAINDDFSRANRGKDPLSPTLIKDGKPVIRFIADQER